MLPSTKKKSVSIINKEAKTRNDPSFICVTGFNTMTIKTEKTFKPKYQTPVSVRKTDVPHAAGTNQKAIDKDRKGVSSSSQASSAKKM